MRRSAVPLLNNDHAPATKPLAPHDLHALPRFADGTDSGSSLRTLGIGQYGTVSPGLGKTMLAKNIAHQAILAGHSALFTTAADLLLDLNGQETARALERRLRHYIRPALLVCDELGYLAYDARAADLLFQLVSRRYEHRSLLITTNLPFKHWYNRLPQCLVRRRPHRPTHPPTSRSSSLRAAAIAGARPNSPSSSANADVPAATTRPIAAIQPPSMRQVDDCPENVSFWRLPTLSGSFIWSLVLTDIASGWTECVPLLVREARLVVDALDHLRGALPFPLRGIDTDNGSEFVNEVLVAFCREQGIEFTRSRPYRKNDQAWVEQKNGAVVRRMVGYGRLEGVPAAEALARLYSAARLFVNVFQPSFQAGGEDAPRRPCSEALPCAGDAVRVPVGVGRDSRCDEGPAARGARYDGPARAVGRDSGRPASSRRPRRGGDGPSDAGT